MKTFNAEFTGYIELSTDQQCDAEIMCERVCREIREVFASHGCISDCRISISTITQKD